MEDCDRKSNNNRLLDNAGTQKPVTTATGTGDSPTPLTHPTCQGDESSDCGKQDNPDSLPLSLAVARRGGRNLEP